VNTGTSEVRDGMRIDFDVPIEADDGLQLRADVYRPAGEGAFPVILSYGPYAKGMSFSDSRPYAWKHLIERYPEVTQGSSSRYQAWEVVDPERWVPDGYAVVRVDSRGTGRSPGYIDPWSPRETRDLYDCIEWAARQTWSNGKVGLNGISYYAINAWQAAARQPPHLAAVCAWEGAADHYRDVCYHGGIFCEFLTNWYARGVIPMQHGYGERSPRSGLTGELVAGPETLPEETLVRNRNDIVMSALAHPFDDDYHRARSVELERIRVPFLSAGNWGGHGLHLRGNTEAFMRAASSEKWLEFHGDTHWTHFYTNDGVDLQKRFFGYFLKGEQNGWDRQPRVRLQVRHPGEKFVIRHENEWPLARTNWTRFYLDPTSRTLGREPPSQPALLKYDSMGDGITFSTPPLGQPMEITGPLCARLYVSSATTNADVFLILRVFTPDGDEVVFQGAQDPHTPIAFGWLRASRRKLDAARSLPYRPYHAHNEDWPLVPGEPVQLDVEIWPTSIVVPIGYRFALTIRGRDYEYSRGAANVPDVPFPLSGVGPFVHADPRDRPASVFNAENALHFAADRMPWLLLPLIPPA
jgi:predicted acyl esterase